MDNEINIKDLQDKIMEQIKQIDSVAHLFLIQKFLENLQENVFNNICYQIHSKYEFFELIQTIKH